MGDWIEVKGWEEYAFEAYRAMPAGKPRGGLVVIHEIFGVNLYVRERCDAFADEGYAVIAPRFWDRIEKGVELDYTREDARHARETFSRVLDRQLAARDLGRFADSMRPYGRVGAVGYSYGATTCWIAAGRIDLAAAVGYYAGTRNYSDLPPRFPVMLHLAERDRRLTPEDVEFLRRDHPAVETHLYPADHGFDCADPRRKVHHPESADLARRRTLDFLARHVG